MKLIDKDALVTEIEKRKSRYNLERKTEPAYYAGLYEGIDDLKDFLDTLEVKEVDLDKETTHYLLYEHRSPLNEIMHQADLKAEMQYHKDIENAYKAGFELGLKAQKVDIVMDE